MDAGEHSRVLVWNRGLANSPGLIVNDQLAQWRAPGIRLRAATLVRTPSTREGSV